MKKRSVVALGVAVLVGGLFSARAAAEPGIDPIRTILTTLDQLLAASGNFSVNLRTVTQNWDKDLPANDPGGPCPSASSRFTCVFSNAAVRDNETGLVWEQSPTTQMYPWKYGSNAREYCLNKVVGGKRGWRLPSIFELNGLVDPSRTDPALPEGHPFSDVSPSSLRGYVSATVPAEGGAAVWMLTFHDGYTNIGAIEVPVHVWCVRGGSNADQY